MKTIGRVVIRNVVEGKEPRQGESRSEVKMAVLNVNSKNVRVYLTIKTTILMTKIAKLERRNATYSLVKKVCTEYYKML